MKRIAMVPCAGFGTRMGEHTKTLPKPLLRVNGVPLVLYSLFMLHLWQAELCVINLHYRGDQMREALRSFPWFPIVFSEETNGILGTAGGIRQAMTVAPLHDRFLFMNPDTIFWPGIDPFAEAEALTESGRLEPPASLLYLSERPPGNTERGFTPASSFAGAPTAGPVAMASAGEWFYSGLSVLHGQAVTHLPPGHPFELRDIFLAQGERQQLIGRPYPAGARRLDCGTAAEYESLKSLDPVPPDLKSRWQAFLRPLELP